MRFLGMYLYRMPGMSMSPHKDLCAHVGHGEQPLEFTRTATMTPGRVEGWRGAP